MIDVKPEIRSLLLANADLVSALGGNKIYSVVAPDSAVLPYITLQEVNNDSIEYADNGATRAQVSVQVDVWSKGNYNNIVSLVDDTLTPLRYVRYFATDMFELEPRVLHKVLRYWVAKELS